MKIFMLFCSQICEQFLTFSRTFPTLQNATQHGNRHALGFDSSYLLILILSLWYFAHYFSSTLDRPHLATLAYPDCF
jgi:hypothetical protein